MTMRVRFILSSADKFVSDWMEDYIRQTGTKKPIEVYGMQFSCGQDGPELVYFGRPDEIPTVIVREHLKIVQIKISDSGVEDRPLRGVFAKGSMTATVTLDDARKPQVWRLELTAQMLSSDLRTLRAALSYYDRLRSDGRGYMAVARYCDDRLAPYMVQVAGPLPIAIVTVPVRLYGSELLKLIKAAAGERVLHERYYDGDSFEAYYGREAIVPRLDVRFFRPDEYYLEVLVISRLEVGDLVPKDDILISLVRHVAEKLQTQRS
jgi:hypothetical protein